MREREPVPATHALPCSGRYVNLTGRTPLVQVRLHADDPSIWCKLEFLHPSGSTKDRVAGYILEKAWRRGDIRRGSTVVEASSGSTSIALALACAQLDLEFIAVMPEGVSNERALIIRSFGGRVIYSPKEQGIHGAIAEAEREARTRRAFLPRQFENPDNAAAHRFGTASEVLAQIPGGTVDAVVSGVGTGGTLVGLYQGFLDGGCQITPFAAKPIAGHSIIEAECSSYSTCIPGVAEGVSKIFNAEALPGLIEIDVDDNAALAAARALIRKGFPVGPSSGLNYAAAVAAAPHLRPDAQIVTVFPDRMERYFSTGLFDGLR